ncbi:hypothetical protein MACH24_12640 [Erythrobacter sp. Dej080120_24]|jgi:hypothetical protein|uniref:hypothetical protein n=1 Tax=Erythrobacter TaxID=1041 RepID=UPI00207A51AC|nr:hypothetical protein [Erythrobacter aurantius]BDW81826.1 hypothetical protein MACH24_12640 [Erythrobacter sp. Dej080120_24]
MSKISIGLLFTAIGLILVATYFDIAFLGSGAGVVLVCGLVYAFVVAKRQAELMVLVLDQRFEEKPAEPVKKPAPVPVGMPELEEAA